MDGHPIEKSGDHMQKTITLLAEKHGLTINETMTEVESVLSTILSHWYRVKVMVHFHGDFQLDAIAYNKIGGIILQKPIDLKMIQNSESIARQLEHSLSIAAILKQTTQYKYYEKEIRWGNITSIDSERNLHVEIEITPGKMVTAICPLNRIGLHEQSALSFSPGMQRAFHLRRIDPIISNGIPRLKVTVDRVSKTLVEALLTEQLGSSAERTVIQCKKRYVGHKSFVFTSKILPKSAIIAVTQELDERMEVRFL